MGWKMGTVEMDGRVDVGEFGWDGRWGVEVV